MKLGSGSFNFGAVLVVGLAIDLGAALGELEDFLLAFSDASVSEVVVVSSSGDDPEDSIDDGTNAEFIQLISDWAAERVGSFRVVYRDLEGLAALLGEREAGEEREGGAPVLLFRDATDFVLASGNASAADLGRNAWLLLKGNDYDASYVDPGGMALALDSLVFVEDGDTMWEWYRVGSSMPVVKAEFGKFEESGFRLTVDPYIWERRGDLMGYQFRTAYVQVPPFVYADEADGGKFKGIMYDLAATLQGFMNFTMDMVETSVYGEKLDNGTWLGVVGMLDRKEADLSVMDLSITKSRHEVVDYALAIYEQSAQLFMLLPRQASSWTTFVGVFDGQFWLSLVFVALFSSLVFHVTFKHAMTHTQQRRLVKSLSSVLLTFGALGASEVTDRMSTRCLFFTACLFGAVVYWSYNAILVSLLTVDHIVLPVNSLQELVDNNAYQVIVTHGTYEEEFLRQATDKSYPVAKKIFDRDVSGNPDALVKTYEEGGNRLLKDSSLVFFNEADSAKLVMTGYPCKIAAAKRKYVKSQVSFAFQKDSPFTSLFSSKILLLRDSGQVEKSLSNYLEEKERMSCHEDGFSAIGYENIFTAFVALVVGAVCAWLTLAGEKIKRLLISK